MNIESGYKYGISLLRKVPKQNFNFNNIGYVHESGTIIFSSQESALLYAKKRVVKALNCEKPFERGIIIEKNAIISEINGNSHSVKINSNNASGNDIITVHGHPEAALVREGHHPNFIRDILFSPLKLKKGKIKHSGITYPVSLADYRCFMQKPNERKCIVFNSKGEYSSLTKNQSGLCMNHHEFNDLVNEYFMTVPNLNSYFSKLKYLFKSFYRFLQPAEKAEQAILNDANKLSNEIHDFLINNTEQYGVRYETNFSNLVK